MNWSGNKEDEFKINNTQILLTFRSCADVPVEAIVLSANNRLILRGATGMAGWLNTTCPALHNECQRQRSIQEFTKGRGILPGSGIITDGPDHKKIIHAVSVDYDRPGSEGQPYAGIDTVAAATAYSIQEALNAGIHSMAIAPMCTRGHADQYLPRNLAETLLPIVQIQVIVGKILTFAPGENIRQIYFCFSGEKDDLKPKSQFQAVQNELNRLTSQ